MLIFSQFTSMHEIIMKELEGRGIDYFYLHGQTPSEKRVQMTDAFNSGEKSIFLISLKAGGTGLNLTGARSEERRVGKECRSRWATRHEKNKVMRDDMSQQP